MSGSHETRPAEHLMLDSYSELRHGRIIGGDGRTSRPRGTRVRPGLDRVSAELCGNRIILAGEIRANRGGGGDPVGPRDRGRRSRRRSVSESQLWRSGGTRE